MTHYFLALAFLQGSFALPFVADCVLRVNEPFIRGLNVLGVGDVCFFFIYVVLVFINYFSVD
jgi:hypothetical protein